MPSRTPTTPHPTSAPRDAARRATPQRWGRNFTPAEDRDHLVRVIAANPNHLGWLREHNARLLEATAARLQEHGHLTPDAIAVMRAEAAQHRTGELTPW